MIPLLPDMMEVLGLKWFKKGGCLDPNRSMIGELDDGDIQRSRGTMGAKSETGARMDEGEIRYSECCRSTVALRTWHFASSNVKQALLVASG